MTPRILVYSHLDEPLFEIDPDKLLGLKMVEKVNGEHSLTISTMQELEKGQRIFYHDGEKLREFVVIGDTASRDVGFSHEYYCVWSLQHDLSGDYIEDRRIGNKNELRGATDILTAIADNSRWQVGTVDSTSLSSAWLYYKSCWDCLGVAVENWNGEVDSTIVLGDPIVRRIDFYDKLGDQEAKRRFDYGYDLTSVKRTVLDDLYVCRIVPRGKGEAVEGEGGEVSGYGRRITIESVNPTGEEWIQDDDAAALTRLPDGNGGYTYPTQIVIYESIETPETLYETALADLETYTRPKVSYAASVLALSGAGMDAVGVELGDAVQIVDKTFGEDGLRISARVIGIERDLLDPSKDALTVGNFQHLLSDTIKKLEDGLSAAQEQLIDTDGKAEASMGIAETAQQVANAVNQHFWDDTQGAHVTEVTKDEWNDSTGPLYQSGANSLWNSLGMLFRKGLTNLLAIVTGDTTGVAIYDGQGNAAANIMASFGATGARIGYAAKAHVAIDADSVDFNDGSTTLASVVNSDGMAGIVIPNSGAVIGGTSSEPVLWIKRTNDNGRIAIGSGHGKPTGEEIQILDGCVYMPSGMSPAAISFGLGGTEATSGTIYAEGRITGAGVTSNGDDSFRANITAFDSTAANPSASQTTHGLLVYDSAGVIVGQIRCARLTDGRIGIALVARQGTSASGGIKQNALWMYTAKDGTATYTVPTPANFRSAIGLGTLATKSSVAASDIEKTAWAYLVGSASTVASGNYVRWRMVAGIVFLQVCYRSGAGLTAGSAKSIGNIPANYRPSSTVESTGYLGAGKASPGDIWVETNGNAYIISATVASATFYGTLCYPLG